MIRNKAMIAFLLIAVVLLTNGLPLKNGDACITADGGEGFCVHVMTRCPKIRNIVRKSMNSSEFANKNRKFIQDSMCGNDNGRMLVCCGKRDVKSELPKPGICGVSITDRIYSGNETKFGEYPWLALIEYKKPNEPADHHCASSLISDRYLVTAAHCMHIEDWIPYRVRLGEWDTNQNPDCDTDSRGNTFCADPHVDVRIEKIIIHPDYIINSTNQFNDIALLRVSQSVAFTDYIKPICLPLKDHLRSAKFEDLKMDIAGWGLTEYGWRSNIKLKATIPIVQLDGCKIVYKSQKKRGFSRDLVESQICAGGERGVDSCNDDSGGSLIGIDSSDKTQVYSFLAGIISYGPRPCGLHGWPGVYTRVGEFVDWIEQNLEP